MKKILTVLILCCLLLPVLSAAEENLPLATDTDLCSHEWVYQDGKSVCSICGAANPCRLNHEEDYEVVMGLYEESVPQYEEEDDCWHSVTGIGDVIKRCPGCGMLLEREDNTEVCFPDFHNYDENHICVSCGHVCTHANYAEGLCMYCGYACPHEELSHEIAYYAFGDYEILYTPVNGNFHRVTGTGTAWDECAACGMKFNVQEGVPLSGTEEHFFEGYECAFCHYMKDPADEEIAAVLKNTLNGDAETGVITDEDGRKAAIVSAYAEKNEQGEKTVLLVLDAEPLQALADRNVTGIVLEHGSAGVLLDVAVLQNQLKQSEGAKLLIELEAEAKIPSAGSSWSGTKPKRRLKKASPSSSRRNRSRTAEGKTRRSSASGRMEPPSKRKRNTWNTRTASRTTGRFPIQAPGSTFPQRQKPPNNRQNTAFQARRKAGRFFL